MEDLKEELTKFLKYVMETHTDSYENLEICTNGDELDPTVENVVSDYLLKNKK